MKINVIISPAVVDELYFSGKTTVVIDVLRATTTIVNALSNGAKEIVPVSSVEFAMKASSSMFGGQTLLAGERNTKMVDGFNMGNSPLEFTAEKISGKAIVLYTTNGTKAIVKSKYSSNVVIVSFLNLNAVADYLVNLNENIEIVCSGRNNQMSLEDTVCAGKLIQAISEKIENPELTDSAAASLALAKSQGKNLKKMMLTTDHGKILVENGFTDDITFCSKTNVYEVVPVFVNGVIKAAPKETVPQAAEHAEQN